MNFDSILDVTIKLLIGVVVAGLGWRFTIYNQRRNAYNQAVLGTYQGLAAQVNKGTIGPVPIDVEAIALHLPKRNQKGFRLAVKAYTEAVFDYPIYASFLPGDAVDTVAPMAELVKNAKAVMAFIPPRL